MQIARGFLSHFNAMMGTYGLYQHAKYQTPLLSEGYCTDDNARAVQMLCHLTPLVSADEQLAIRELFQRCWEFIHQAQIEPGYFTNFRSVTGEWLPQGTAESEDMYARIIRALSEVLHSPDFSEYHAESSVMIEPLIKRASERHMPRFCAEYLIATKDMSDTHAWAAQIILELWKKNSSPDWPWFEKRMTYANALLPHGLLSVLESGPDTEVETILHASAEFLINTTIKDGMFIPIGNNGWYSRGGKPSQYDQQAIEASTMLDFLIDYNQKYPSLVPYANVVAPYLWFFGNNTNSVVMADEKNGSCYDGLSTKGPNQNRGAESMLAYQWAEIRMREVSPQIQQFAEEQKRKIPAR